MCRTIGKAYRIYEKENSIKMNASCFEKQFQLYTDYLDRIEVIISVQLMEGRVY